MLKTKKGITLVALVVTIVVLFILAGISVNLVLGNDGLIERAKEAREKTAQGQENTQKEMNIIEKNMDKSIGEWDPRKNLPTKTVEEAKADYVDENTKVDFSDGTVVIPEGFKIADDSADTVAGGVVVEDKKGNQYVWIAVDSIDDYKRTAYSSNILTDQIDEGTNSAKIQFSSKHDIYFYEALPEDEKESIKGYKGFYIGRYEAGDEKATADKKPRSSDVASTVTIKKGQAPYNYVTRTEAISLAENFGKSLNYKAKTKLASSYAWDTMLEFIKSKTKKDYGNNSAEGNYTDTSFSYKDLINNEDQTKNSGDENDTLVPTGSTTPVCNIYDMGGNVWEWSTETNSSDIPGSCRGGDYGCSSSVYSAGFRYSYQDKAFEYVGFRIALFM